MLHHVRGCGCAFVERSLPARPCVGALAGILAAAILLVTDLRSAAQAPANDTADAGANSTSNKAKPEQPAAVVSSTNASGGSSSTASRGAPDARPPGTSLAELPIDKIKASAISDEDVIAFINSQIRQGWKDASISPSAAANDGEWCRRLYLDVVGRVPTVDELQKFTSSKGRRRKAELVDRLLSLDAESAEQYVEEYARNWTTIWTNILVGRADDDDDDDRPVNRPGMQQYLRRSFVANKSYDQLVLDLVSAKGSNTPGTPDYNGAVNFILDNLQENAATATAKTARYFLGLQVQCTQCHNHPFNSWKQDQFWGMNAFFRQTAAFGEMRGRDGPARLLNQDFAGESGRNPKEAEIFFELRNGISQVAYPTFVDGTKIDPSGYLDEVDRRTQLARLIVGSDYFGKAIVNRMWAHFMGYGFTKPIDDLGPHNEASHPDLLDKLGAVFAGSGHDLKRLIRWIVLSEPYALSSRFAGKNRGDDPSLGEKPLFSRFYVRQIRAEELYESLLVTTQAHQARGSYEEQEKAKSEWLQQFTIAFGTDEGDETTTFNGTIPQALMMFNGDLIQKATSIEPGTFLHKLATNDMKPAQRIDHLYLCALARRPTGPEKQLAGALVAARGGDVAAAMQDIWWALLNSNEFILNH